MTTLKNHREKISESVNIHMSKIMCTPIKVSTHTYTVYANCPTPLLFKILIKLYNSVTFFISFSVCWLNSKDRAWVKYISFKIPKKFRGWSRADLIRSVYRFGRHLWVPKFKKGRKRKTKVWHKNKKTVICKLLLASWIMNQNTLTQ